VLHKPRRIIHRRGIERQRNTNGDAAFDRMDANRSRGETHDDRGCLAILNSPALYRWQVETMPWAQKRRSWSPTLLGSTLRVHRRWNDVRRRMLSRMRFETLSIAEHARSSSTEMNKRAPRCDDAKTRGTNRKCGSTFPRKRKGKGIARNGESYSRSISGQEVIR